MLSCSIPRRIRVTEAHVKLVSAQSFFNQQQFSQYLLENCRFLYFPPKTFLFRAGDLFVGYFIIKKVVVWCCCCQVSRYRRYVSSYASCCRSCCCFRHCSFSLVLILVQHSQLLVVVVVVVVVVGMGRVICACSFFSGSGPEHVLS